MVKPDRALRAMLICFCWIVVIFHARPLGHHRITEQRAREAPPGTSRWNPTPEGGPHVVLVHYVWGRARFHGWL